MLASAASRSVKLGQSWPARRPGLAADEEPRGAARRCRSRCWTLRTPTELHPKARRGKVKSWRLREPPWRREAAAPLRERRNERSPVEQLQCVHGTRIAKPREAWAYPQPPPTATAPPTTSATAWKRRHSTSSCAT